MNNSARITSFVIAVLIAAFALFLRVRAVDQLPIDYDEDDYLRAGQQIALVIQNRDFGQLFELNYRTEHPQLQKLFYGQAISSLPATEEIPDRATTSPPAASLPEPHLTRARVSSSLLNVILVFVLALFNPLAGLILAIHTYTIKYTSQVMLESLPMLTSFLAVYFYWRSDRKRNSWILLAGITLGLTAASKYIYAIVGIAILVDWLIHLYQQQSGNRTHQAVTLLVWGGVALLIFFVANPYLWPNPVFRLYDSLVYHSGYAQSAAVQQVNFPFWQPFVWLFSSVAWHPGVFLIRADFFVALGALIGLPRILGRYRVFVLWLAVGIFFLVLWPTKWAQYILVIMVPVSLSAAAGWQEILLSSRSFIKNFRPNLRVLASDWRQSSWRVLPWLAPGLLLLSLIAIYPLIFQGAMSLTDFTSASIKDGLNGGVWREVWLGLTGQVEPVAVRFFSFNPAREVNYAGPNLLLSILFSLEGASLLMFEVIWATLSVGVQVAIGVAAATILMRYSRKIQNMLLALLILPWAIPEFVGALMWLQIFDPRFGWFILAQSNFTQRVDLPFLIAPVIPAWQSNPGQALLYLLFPAVWYGFPFMLLAASAGLKLIPDEVHEAAAIDGANAWQRFTAVTWPMLMPLLIPAVVIRLIFAFNQFYIFLTFQTPFPVTTFATSSYNLFADAGAYAFSAGLNIAAILFLVLAIFFFNRWTRASAGVTYAA